MWQKTPEELRAVLSAPFSSSDIEWRVSATNAEKTKGLAVPYVTNRAIQNRLDDTVGIDGWYNDFRPWKNGSAQLCGISIFFPQLEQCLTKWDGADDSEFESVKGGLSDSMKRAAVEWSIGRYLYGMTQVWVTVQITNSGKKSNARIRDEERPRLDQAHDEWVAYLQAKERGENPPRPKGTPAKGQQKTDFAHQRGRVCGNPQALLLAHIRRGRRQSIGCPRPCYLRSVEKNDLSI